MATNKKTVIRKKIGNAVYNLLPQTSSDIVTHVTTGSVSTTVAALLNTLNDTMGTLSESTVGDEIDAKILAFKKEIYGVNSDEYKTGIAAALDTIKEIADILGDSEEAGTVIANIATLKAEVETATTGLLDRVSTIESDLNTATTGLKARVSALESFTTGQTTDDVPVGPNEDRNYVTTTEKAKIASSANVTVLASTATSDTDVANAEDLYFLEISAPVADGAGAVVTP